MFYRNVMNSSTAVIILPIMSKHHHNTLNNLLISFLFCFSRNLPLFVRYCYQVILDLFGEFKYFKTNRAHAD